MLRNREHYLELGNCVNVTVYSKSTSQSTWAVSNGNNYRTCDRCINKERICARLVKVDGVIKLAVFSLPGTLRRNKKWDELDYWV